MQLGGTSILIPVSSKTLWPGAILTAAPSAGQKKKSIPASVL
jgi:hypothetical protein